MIIKINQAAVEAKQKQDRIAEIKQLLAATDYKTLPDYDKPNEDAIVQRAAWRAEIRELEQQ